MPRVGPLAEVSVSPALGGPLICAPMAAHRAWSLFSISVPLPVCPAATWSSPGVGSPGELGQLFRSRPLVWGPGLGQTMSWK